MNNHLEFSIKDTDIAVIGLACRFPGAKNINEFWKLLKEGKEGIRQFTEDELREHEIDNLTLSKLNYIKVKGVIDDIEKFSPDFFGINPNDAIILDPQHRIFLELCWEALESAGYTSSKTDDIISVFAGASDNTYLQNLLKDNNLSKCFNNYQLTLANSNHFLSTKISYHLNLKGISVNVQTACSTSLVAIIMACQSIISGESDLALAGGICIRVPQECGYFYQEGSIYSRDGHCRAFDKAATGTVSSNGAGVVVLKQLTQAIKDNDHIDAVIKSFSINNDGSRKTSFAAPSMLEQSRCIATALSDVNPETISYIEAHGTGTYIGDPIEIEALTKAFRYYTQKEQFCAIGSVKTNIGHTDTASGVAGFIKTVLCLKNKLLVPSLHFNDPNPNIKFSGSPFYVNTKLADWKSDDYKLRAGVSSFGIGGTNAHLILEEPPYVMSVNNDQAEQIIILSAKSQLDLRNQKLNILKYLQNNNDISLNDLAFTLQVGRKDFEIRQAFLSSDTFDLMEMLSKDLINNSINNIVNDNIVFLFGHYDETIALHGLVEEIYYRENLFKDIINGCIEQLPNEIQQNVLHFLINLPVQKNNNILNGTIKNISTFIFQYALGKYLITLNVKPKLLLAHGIGEIVVLALVELLSLKDAINILMIDNNLNMDLLYNKIISVIKYLTPRFSFLLSSANKLNHISKLTLSSLTNNVINYSSICDNIEYFSQNNIYFALGAANQIQSKLEEKNTKNVYSIFSDQCLPIQIINLYQLIIKAWLNGQNINWLEYQHAKNNKRLRLPTYPFTKQRYWIERLSTTNDNCHKDSYMYINQWVVCQKKSKKTNDNTLYIIFCENNHLKDYFKQSESTILVFQGLKFQKIGVNEYQINPQNKNEFEMLFQSIKLLTTVNVMIIYSWDFNCFHERISNIVKKLPTDNFMKILYLFQSINKLHHYKKLNFYCVANQLYKVLDNDIIIPQKHYLIGELLVISQEYNVSIRIIDTDMIDNNFINAEIQIDDEAVDIHVAYRKGIRYVKTYNQIVINKQSTSPHILKDKGHYLLIGGLGNIGLEIAGFLAKEYAANLILTTRHDVQTNPINFDKSNDKYIKLTEIYSHASSVQIKKLDVTNVDQVGKLTDELKYLGISLDAIFHLASNINESNKKLINDLEIKQVDQQFLPKIMGAYACKFISQKVSVGHCIFFSSLSSIIGGLGLAAYSAANSILDAFIYKENNKNKQLKWISLNWDRWRKNHDIYILERILKYQYKIEQCIISHSDLYQHINQNINQKMNQQLSDFILNTDDIENIICNAFKTCLGLYSIDQNDDFFKNLNGNSLSALNLLEDINYKLNIHLKIADLIQNPSILKLSKIIKSLINDNNNRCIIKLNEHNDNNAYLFLIHPVGGTVFCYHELVNQLTNNYNCYGIQDPAIEDCDDLPYHSFEDLCHQYLNEIKKIQASGPYLLVGYSYGGNICYEIANQLNHQDKCYIFLIDSWATLSSELKNYNTFRDSMLKTLERTSISLKSSGEIKNRLLKLSWERMLLMFNYIPPKTDLSLVLFKAVDILPEYASIDEYSNNWQYLIKNQMDIHLIEGDHKTLLDYPGVETISTIINNYYYKILNQ